MLSELQALVILASTPSLGSARIRQLVTRFGSALAVLEANPAEIGTEWKENSTWKRTLDLAEEHEVEVISYTSTSYPKRLLELNNFPILLYVKGSIQPEDSRSIAVVGTRHASIYGKEMAYKISNDLAAAGYTVVSGLARGIDTAAHAGALTAGRTIAVIGSGLADIYPRENLFLAKSIAEKGAVISEFPMATPPDRQNFPQRNRIVSGMTLGTLLIEAPYKSGAMITIEKAIDQKRRVFVLPGRADNENFKGNHSLLKNGKGQLIENAGDIINSFHDLFGQYQENEKATKVLRPLGSLEEEAFLSKLPTHEVSIDDMVHLTKLPVMKVNIMITRLVLKKLLK